MALRQYFTFVSVRHFENFLSPTSLSLREDIVYCGFCGDFNTKLIHEEWGVWNAAAKAFSNGIRLKKKFQSFGLFLSPLIKKKSPKKKLFEI